MADGSVHLPVLADPERLVVLIVLLGAQRPQTLRQLRPEHGGHHGLARRRQDGGVVRITAFASHLSLVLEGPCEAINERLVAFLNFVSVVVELKDELGPPSGRLPPGSRCKRLVVEGSLVACLPNESNCVSASRCISRQPSLPAVVVTNADDIIIGRWYIAAAYESCSTGSKNSGCAPSASTRPTTVRMA